MSMLAEPRRKQKWSVDPRNSTWSKDDSKFGQKMLERMGWSKGKGLGRSEQGSTEHIKVKIKNNNHGLGANASHEDNWIAHQDDFNKLLAQLNSHHGQTPSSEAPSEEKKGFSLEEKSKTSRKRVHYMKFTKGKDLSSRSETDLNCIFGKRSRLEKDQEQESSSSASQSEMEENGTSSAVELDTESITKTVTSTLTMQEYFAQRMAQLKKNRGNQSAALSADSAATEELTAGQICYATEEPKKKKKKKKKNKELVEEVVDEESSSSVVIKDKDNQDNLEKKGLRKKKKDNLNDTNEKVSADVELNLEHLSSSKKKKSKKNKQEEPIKGCDSRESVEITQTKEQDSLVIESDAAQVEKKSKKKKRKMKSQD